MTKNILPTTVLADVSEWSEKSKQSVAFLFRREYTDIPYNCWHCRAACIFTAEDQKFTFEVKKASVNQRRILCNACWVESNRIRALLRECEEKWRESKAQLRGEGIFLVQWLELLEALEQYIPYKPDTAKKNMLAKLISSAPA